MLERMEEVWRCRQGLQEALALQWNVFSRLKMPRSVEVLVLAAYSDAAVLPCASRSTIWTRQVPIMNQRGRDPWPLIERRGQYGHQISS